MDDQTTGTPEGPEATGSAHHDPVEAVLSSVEGLDERPVAEHVAVFEQAHESLRRVLAGDGARG